MKILAIMGSPHKGNTLELTQNIESKLKHLGDVEFKYAHLKDLDLKSCRGCYVCFDKGEHFCPLKDDKEELSHQLKAADGVIFASPVYSMHVTYLFKTFVDRFAYTFHRPCYFGKYALVIAAAGNPGLEETLKYLKSTAGAWGFEVVGELGYYAVPKNTALVPLATRKDRTDEIVGKFHQALREKKPRKLKWMDHLHFRMMQSIYSRIKTMSPTDYRYFRENGWFESRAKYFTAHAKGNIFYDFAAKMMGGMVGRKIDRTTQKAGASKS